MKYRQEKLIFNITRYIMLTIMFSTFLLAIFYKRPDLTLIGMIECIIYLVHNINGNDRLSYIINKDLQNAINNYSGIK